MTDQTSPDSGPDIVDELRQAAGNLIKGVIDDSEVPVAMLSDAADEIERLRPYVEAFRREETRADKLGQELDDMRGHAQSPDVDLMQRVWANLYYNEEDAGNTFQQTLNEVVDWLAERNALPKVADSSTVRSSK